MLIKLRLTPIQLETLQHVLADDPCNRGGYTKGSYSGIFPEVHFVSIEDVKCPEDFQETPLPPFYVVTLRVRESYYKEKPKGQYDLLENPIKTPLVRLSRVLQAIGLFPDNDGEPV